MISADRDLVLEAIARLTPPKSEAARQQRELLLCRYGKLLDEPRLVPTTSPEAA